MATITPQLVSQLEAEVGEPLRFVAEYAAESYTVHYVRDDIRQQHTTEQIDEIAEELVLEGLNRIRLEDLFDAGSLHCSMHCFDEATMCQFVRDDFGGLFLTIDTDPEVNVIRLVQRCKELVADETVGTTDST